MSSEVVVDETPPIFSWAWLKRPLPSLFAIAILTRLLVVVAAAIAAATLGTGTGWNRGPGFVQYFSRWDSGFYMDIAQLGYGFKPEAWAFDPGYPIVVGVLWRLVPGLDLPTAGFLVSNAAFFGTIPLFHKLTARWFDEDIAWRATVFLAVVPGAFYFSAVYADALFLLLLIATFLALDEKRWLLAGVLASCAAITRPPGLFLIGAFGVAVLVQAYRTRRLAWRPAAGLAVALTLPATLAIASWKVTGDWNISAHAREVYWPNVQWHWPWTLFDLGGVSPTIKAAIIVAMTVLVLSMAYVAWLARRAQFLPVAAFSVVLGTTYLSYAEPNPIFRYLVAIPPLYWLLAKISLNKWVMGALATLMIALQLAVAAIFASWGPLY